MPESDSYSSAGKTGGQIPTIAQVVARVQRLCDIPRPEDGYPIAAFVEGYFLGDITAIVAAAKRSERLVER